MFDLRINGILAGIAFILSLLIGLVSRTTMPRLIFRPLIFAVLFFALSTVVKIVVNRFLPELLEEDEMEDGPFRPGSRIDITEDDSQVYSGSDGLYRGLSSAVAGQSTMAAKPDDSDENLGNISDLASKASISRGNGGEILAGMDHKVKEGYTVAGEMGDFSESAQDGVLGADFDDFTSVGQGPGRAAVLNSEEALPDLDSMAGAFMSASEVEETEMEEFSSSGPLRKPSSAKPPAWTEDFNAKEIAQGLRTVLNKDKEG